MSTGRTRKTLKAKRRSGNEQRRPHAESIMRGLDALQRKLVENIKECGRLRLTFPANDGVCGDVTMEVTDRTAIHRIALSVQTWYLEQNKSAKNQ